jgi:hypothetical protein
LRPECKKKVDYSIIYARREQREIFPGKGCRGQYGENLHLV